jgi:hypothetical protein
MTDWIVADLQGQAPLEGLAVRDPRLGFDSGAPVLRLPAADFRVPRPKVALKRKRHLRSPAQAWMKARPKALQERELCPVPDRIARRIRADTQVEPHDRAPGSNVGDADAIQLAMFEAPQLAVRSPGSSGSIAQAQSGRDPGVAMLLAETPERIAGSSPTAICRSLSRTHRAEGCAVGLHWRCTADSCFGRRNKGRTRGPIRTPNGVVAAICCGGRNNWRRRCAIRAATVAPVAPCYGRRNRGAR